jgi:hypothetical protein
VAVNPTISNKNARKSRSGRCPPGMFSDHNNTFHVNKLAVVRDIDQCYFGHFSIARIPAQVLSPRVVLTLGSDDVVSSVPQFLDGAIISGVEHFFMLCLYN